MTPKKPKTVAPSTPKATPKSTPKKFKTAKPTVEFKSLEADPKDSTPVDVEYEDGTLESKILDDEPGFGHMLKLRGTRAFTLVTTTMLTEGTYSGFQAVIIRPAKAFPFMKLSEEVRVRIYKIILAPKTGTIVLDCVNSARKAVTAKIYANGDKHRLAILGVSKEIRKAAFPIVYSNCFSFESTSTLLNWLSQVGKDVRSSLVNINVKLYVKSSAHTALHFLAECDKLDRLHFEQGVGVDKTPAKAVKDFYADAYRFLEAMGTAKGDKAAGMKILSFGNGLKCFSIKEKVKDKEGQRAWSDAEKEEFLRSLKAKLG
ncbi:hypothetical protein LTR66_001933 [Elasticomyces elasticus]|nr:hypothetical protein LTR66_001933 [Elasticomyces elasticus]